MRHMHDIADALDALARACDALVATLPEAQMPYDDWKTNAPDPGTVGEDEDGDPEPDSTDCPGCGASEGECACPPDPDEWHDSRVERDVEPRPTEMGGDW